MLVVEKNLNLWHYTFAGKKYMNIQKEVTKCNIQYSLKNGQLVINSE